METYIGIGVLLSSCGVFLWGVGHAFNNFVGTIEGVYSTRRKDRIMAEAHVNASEMVRLAKEMHKGDKEPWED